MLTSCVQVSNAGLNSAPLAVTLPTPSSAHCSVPNELLKLLKTAGGQGLRSLAVSWHSPGVPPSPSTRAHTMPARAPHSPPREACGSPSSPHKPVHPRHRKSLGDRLKCGATPSASDPNPQPSCGNNLLCDFGQVPFPLSLWTIGGLNPVASRVLGSADPLWAEGTMKSSLCLRLCH